MAGNYYNPFFDDPNLKTVSSNIAKVFVDPNPGQTMVAQRRARYYDLQNDKLSSEANSRSKIAASFRNGGALNPAELAAAGVEGYIKPDDVSGYTLYYDANQGAPDDVTARAYVGTGKAIGKDQGFSIADREGVAKRENDAALNRTATSAGISAAASRANNAARIQYAIDHPDEAHVKGSALNDYIKANPSVVGPLFLKPQNTPAGGQTNFAPGDPRATGPVVKGPAADGKPGAATPEVVQDIELLSLQSIPGALYTDKNGKPVAVDEDFRGMFGPKMAQAKEAAAQVYRETHDAALASKAYRDALGIAPGSRFAPRESSSLFNWGGSDPKIVPSAGDVPVPTPAPTKITQPLPPAATGGMTPDPLAQARDAINRGANRAAVIQRLQAMGIDPSGL